MRKLILFLFLVCNTTYGVNIANYDPVTINNPATYDLSGVGIAGSQWGTLIAPNVIISASHWAPNGTIEFPSGESSEISLRMNLGGGGDIFLGVLSTPIWDATVYPFATDPWDISVNAATNVGNMDWADPELVMLGFNGTRSLGGVTPALGILNTIGTWDGVEAGLTVGSYRNTSLVPIGSGVLQSGDSGAPAFVRNLDGELTLIGTAWRANSAATWWNYVGQNQNVEGITDFLNAHAVSVPSGGDVATPEPTRTILAMIGLSLIMLRRHRGV